MTVVGAAANIVVTGMSDKLERGRITFSNYLNYSFPVVLISGIIATVYILIKYLL
jgi:Na+/H+ antiporter NhaD/arsenite permease-like protein